MEDRIEIPIPVENECPYEITAVSAGDDSLVYVRNSTLDEIALFFPDIEEFGDFLDSLEEAYCIFHDEVYND